MNAPARESPLASWFTAGLGLSVVLLLGRLTGFIREILIAAQFGAERTADQLIILLTIPDVLTNLLTTGAMLYVLVPEFRRSDGGRAASLFRQASFWVVVLLGGISFIAAVALPNLTLSLFAPGFSNAHISEMTWILPLFLCLAPVTGMTSISTAWLQSGERFSLPAFGTIILNGCLIAGLVVAAWTGRPFLTVGCALLAGGVLRYASQYVALRSGFAAEHTVPRIIDRKIVARYMTALLAGGLFLLFPVIARAFASDVDGGVAVFNYAIKLADLPLGIAITVLPLMLLPRMTDALDRAEDGQAQAMSRTSLYATLAVALSIAIPAAWFASSVVEILYGWTGLAQADLKRISMLAAIAFLAIPAQGAVAHCMSVLNAANQQRTVLMTSVLALALFVALSWLLKPVLGPRGVMVALVAGYTFGWGVFVVLGTSAINWRLSDFGPNRSVAMLLAVVAVIATAFAGFSQLLPNMLILDVVIGALWCAATLASAMLVYRISSP